MQKTEGGERMDQIGDKRS